jgi:hypothetical protein
MPCSFVATVARSCLFDIKPRHQAFTLTAPAAQGRWERRRGPYLYLIATGAIDGSKSRLQQRAGRLGRRYADDAKPVEEQLLPLLALPLPSGHQMVA